MSVEEKVFARRAPNRCPFCHEGCEADDATVCQDCLARHHAGCWTESARCAACGSDRRLAPAPRTTPAAVARAEAGGRTEERAGRGAVDILAGGVIAVITVGASAVASVILSEGASALSFVGHHPVESVDYACVVEVALLVPAITAGLVRTLGGRVTLALAAVIAAGLLTIFGALRGLAREDLGTLAALWTCVAAASGAIAAVGTERFLRMAATRPAR